MAVSTRAVTPSRSWGPICCGNRTEPKGSRVDVRWAPARLRHVRSLRRRFPGRRRPIPNGDPRPDPVIPHASASAILGLQRRYRIPPGRAGRHTGLGRTTRSPFRATVPLPRADGDAGDPRELDTSETDTTLSKRSSSAPNPTTLRSKHPVQWEVANSSARARTTPSHPVGSPSTESVPVTPD